MNSPFVNGAALIVLAAALGAIGLSAILFGAHVLAPIDSAPAASVSAAAPAPAASASAAAPKPRPSFNDYDLAKRDRQIDWCEHHKGIPTMTFWHDHSNVLCLRPESIIPLPAGEPE
jgi:hypothetical protein